MPGRSAGQAREADAPEAPPRPRQPVVTAEKEAAPVPDVPPEADGVDPPRRAALLKEPDATRPPAAVPDDWPWWRGPTLNNAATADQNPPVRWSENDNVVWRAALPGRGHATPCIRGTRIFLPSADEKQQVIWMLCFDRRSGKRLWRTEVWRGNFPKIHKNNSHASAMPACDGERVYFPYQTADAVRMAALDLDGKVVWDRKVGPYKSLHGYSASPAMYKSTVIVPTDGSAPNKLTALDRRTGEVAWQVPRPDEHESYASPLVARVAGRDQLFIIGPDKTRSYDPNNGALLWECTGPADFDAATVAFGKDMIYATGGWRQRGLMCIRADGTGDVTATHVVWKSDRKAGYVPSPLLVEGLVYAVSDKGLMRSYDAASGEIVWEKDLGAKFYSSPVLVGERIFLFDRKGKGYVVRAGRRFELVAESTLPDGAFATPVICAGRIYLRTLGDFYCLGEKR